MTLDCSQAQVLLGSFLSSLVELYFKNCMIYNTLITTADLHFFVPLKIKCLFYAVQKCRVETRLWLVNPEHVLAI